MDDYRRIIEFLPKAWVALGKSFHLCRLKNHENSKPQPEEKTFSQIEEGRTSNLVGVNCRCFDTLRTKVGQKPENIISS